MGNWHRKNSSVQLYSLYFVYTAVTERKKGRKEGREEERKEGRKEGRQAGRKEGRKERRKKERNELILRVLTKCEACTKGFPYLISCNSNQEFMGVLITYSHHFQVKKLRCRGAKQLLKTNFLPPKFRK